MSGDAYDRILLLVQANKPDAAARLAREALTREPGWAHGHVLLAQALTGLRDWRGALAAAREGVRLAPEDAYAFHVLSIALQNSGFRHRRAALRAAEHAVRLGPWDAFAFARCAAAANRLGRFAEGLTRADLGLAIDPENRYGLFERGWALVNSGRAAEAEAIARAALALYPEAAEFHDLLGLAHVQLAAGFSRGRHKRHMAAAAACFREAARLKPTEPEYRSRAGQPNSVRGRPECPVYLLLVGTVWLVGLFIGLSAKADPNRYAFAFAWHAWGCPAALALLIPGSVVQVAMPGPGSLAGRPDLPRWKRQLGRAFWVIWPLLAFALAAAQVWQNVGR